VQDEIIRIVLLLTTLIIGASPARAVSLHDTKRPNIIVIVGDDVGWGDLGSYGASKIQTPNLDRLAHEGLRFTDAHASAAVCTPTRFSLLTGEYSWRNDAYGLNKGVADGNSPLLIKPGTVTLPSILKSAGYRTKIVGKWYLGRPEAWPPGSWLRRVLRLPGNQ